MGHHHEDIGLSRLRGILLDGGADAETVAEFDMAVSRRTFFRVAGRGGALVALAGFGAGTDAVLNGLFGRGLLPVAWAQEANGPSGIESKPDMVLHNSRPVSGEFPPHLLDDDVTPTRRHFVRNNGAVPQRAIDQDPRGWMLTIDGEVHRPLELTLDDLKKRPAVSLPLMIECGGNGRALFDPPVRGNPWRHGAVGCGLWTGVRLKDLLTQAGLKESARYTAHYGEDRPIGQVPPFSRGIPIAKAMEEHTIVAYRLNGEDLSALHGFPARLVVPGWIGSCSQKWLTRIWIRDKVHDSKKMTGFSYRIPAHPVVPGKRPSKSDMQIVTSWIIKSLIACPAADQLLSAGERIRVSGHAWAGEDKVSRVAVSTDYGMHWLDANLTAPPNHYAWYRWDAEPSFCDRGYYEIWARAFDDKGNAQPFRQPWNPKGYLGNVIHRVPVVVEQVSR